jgi:acetyl esterase/lipase
MPLDPRAKRFLDRLAALNPPNALELTPGERRDALESLLSFSARREAVANVDDRVLRLAGAALPLRIYSPAAIAGRWPALVYFHGGGFVAGSIDTHDHVGRALANATDCRVISVGYRLAPEHPFPVAIEDAYAATAWVAEHADELAIDAALLGVAGDSAGATLAAAVCQRAAAMGTPRLAMQLLLCPIMDYGAQSASRQAFAQGYFVEEATLQHDLKHYLGPDGDACDPRVSPLRASKLEGLPPTCIHTAEFDPLRDEGQAYAGRLEAAGVPTIYRCHPGMIHLFYGMPALLPYAATAYQMIGADVKGLLPAGSEGDSR